MCPLFGGTNKRDADRGGESGTRSEVDRLGSLPLEQLAEEVIARGFKLDDTENRGRASVHDVAERMVPDYLRQSQEQVWDLQELIGEGVQLLEHAALAQCTIVGNDRRLQWVLTRRGRNAIADGSVSEALAKLS
jgi:hypothetical protein